MDGMNTAASRIRFAFFAAIAVIFAALPVRAQTSVRVCSHPAAGFFEKDAKGAFSGLEYDLIASFGESAGLKLTYRETGQFDELLKDVEAGACDIGASTITITEPRKARMLFSIPYFPNRIVIVQKTSSGFTSGADLKDKRVAVVTGTLSEPLVAAIPGVKVLRLANDDMKFQALLQGEADALASDSAVVLHYLKKNPQLGVAFPLGERSFFGLVFPKSSNVAEAMNEHLRKLIRTGEMKKLLTRHFGADNAESLIEDITEASGRK